jgi:hypothetical protein
LPPHQLVKRNSCLIWQMSAQLQVIMDSFSFKSGHWLSYKTQYKKSHQGPTGKPHPSFHYRESIQQGWKTEKGKGAIRRPRNKGCRNQWSWGGKGGSWGSQNLHTSRRSHRARQTPEEGCCSTGAGGSEGYSKPQVGARCHPKVLLLAGSPSSQKEAPPALAWPRKLMFPESLRIQAIFEDERWELRNLPAPDWKTVSDNLVLGSKEGRGPWHTRSLLKVKICLSL